MANQFEVTLKRSLIGSFPKHRKTAKALGLRKLHKPILVNDSPQTRGMVKAIEYLVSVRELED